MRLPDLFIQLPFTMCQAQRQVLDTDRNWIRCLPWRGSQPGGGERDGSADYSQSSMGREIIETRAQGRRNGAGNSKVPKSEDSKSKGMSAERQVSPEWESICGFLHLNKMSLYQFNFLIN